MKFDNLSKAPFFHERKIKAKSLRLRLCQEKALTKLERLLGPAPPNKKFMIVMPTGTGKSLVISLAPFVLEAHKVLIIEPGKELAGQMTQDLQKEYTEGKVHTVGQTSVVVNKYDAGKSTVQLSSSDVVVTNVQALVDEHKGQLRANATQLISTLRPDLLIFDEGHHEQAGSYQRLIDEACKSEVGNGACKVILCTATPLRGDGKRFNLTRGASDDESFFYMYTRDEALKEKPKLIKTTEVRLAFELPAFRAPTLIQIMRLDCRLTQQRRAMTRRPP